MHAPQTCSTGEACDLDSVIATAQLDNRPRRPVDSTFETEILLEMSRALAADPRTLFQKLVEAVLRVSQADSAGISLLNQKTQRFIWPAVAGPFHAYLWEGTPRNFGPCGTVLERDGTQLMLHPERHFTYLQPIRPVLEEVLLVPFYLEGTAVGTIWAVIHGTEQHFDSEDRRMLESMSAFAASAYQTLFKAGALEPFLQKNRVGVAMNTPLVGPSHRSPADDLPRHRCMIYEGAPSSNLRSVALSLIDRLKSGYRCLYLNSMPMVAGMRWHLAAAGLDLEKQMERRALILTSERPQLVEGKFDLDLMFRSLDEALQQALAEGYAGLWAAGDMTWEFGNDANLEKLLEYEHRLDGFLKTQPALSGICLYHRNSLPAHAIQTALKTHPTIYVSDTLSQLNPLYGGGALS